MPRQPASPRNATGPSKTSSSQPQPTPNFTIGNTIVEWIQLYSAALIAKCSSQGFFGPDAEELLNVVFSEAALALRKSVSIQCPKAWLIQILHNMCLKEGKKRSIRNRNWRPLSDASDVASDSEVERLEDIDELEHMLGRLRTPLRTVIKAYLKFGNVSEVAGALGISITHTRRLFKQGCHEIRRMANARGKRG